MYFGIVDMSHFREVDVHTIFHYRLYTCATAIYIAINIARLYEHSRLTAYGTKIVAIAIGIIAIRLSSESGTIDVVAIKLTVGFYIGVARYIASITATMNLKHSNAWCAM